MKDLIFSGLKTTSCKGEIGMAVHEAILLKRFTENRDADAFSEIVNRYANPVYNTCRRILFDEASASDAAQETFYQLMCSADSVKGSLAAWLHSVATHKAIDAIRRSAARKAREHKYALSKPKEVNQWKDISPYIDQEMEKLSPEHREVLIQYFFENQTMTEIAEHTKVSQPTVSRMVAAAVEELRKRLRKKGIIVAAIVLGELIGKNTLQAAPSVLLAEMGKMSLAGATTGLLSPSMAASPAATVWAAGGGSLSTLSAGTAKAAVSAAFSTVKAKVATAIAVTAIGTGAVVTYNTIHNPDTETESTAVQKQTDDTAATFTASKQPILLGGQNIGGGGFGGAAIVAVTPAEGVESMINLSDPEATIDSFTELLITDNLDYWKECFTEDSQALVDLNRIMTNPVNSREQQIQDAFNSIGNPVEIIELLETENGVAMILLYIVYDPFVMDNGKGPVQLQEGDQLGITAEVVMVGNQWKISDIDIADAIPD